MELFQHSHNYSSESKWWTAKDREKSMDSGHMEIQPAARLAMPNVKTDLRKDLSEATYKVLKNKVKISARRYEIEVFTIK